MIQLRARISGQSPDVLALDPMTTGRYIRVQLSGTNYLSLAEVQAFEVIPSVDNPEPQQACDVTTAALQRTVRTGVWSLLSLPCEPPEGLGVAELFEDDVPGELGLDWIVYLFDPASNSYTAATADTALKQGEGFWFIQLSGEDRTLDLPVGSTPWSTTSNTSACLADQGCTSLALSGTISPSNWQIIGNPLTTSILVDSINISSSTGPCSSSAGCTLAEASDSEIGNLVYAPLWRLDDSASPPVYQAIGSGDALAPWDGLWIAERAGAENNMPELHFPIGQ